MDAVIAALIYATYWVYKDAGKRGMNAIGWAIGTFLLCIIIFPLYLIMRKPVIILVEPSGFRIQGTFVPQLGSLLATLWGTRFLCVCVSVVEVWLCLRVARNLCLL